MTAPTPPAPPPLRPHPLLEQYYADEAERRLRVDSWFDRAALHYDAITQALSFGSGHWYRRRTLDRTGFAPGMRTLDVACGTGILTVFARDRVGERGLAVGLDASRGMLLAARARGVMPLTQGLAEELPFGDGSFDRLSMGYALRHVRDLHAAFREFRRVLSPGGRLVLLEITPPRSAWSRALLRWHLRTLVPLFARALAGDRETGRLMEYFWDTIDACVPPESILGALTEVGFTAAEREVELGIFSNYRATR